MKKETWINEVMSSVKDQKMAEVNPFLHTRVIEKIRQQTATVMPVKWMLAIGCCIAVLFLLNLAIFSGGMLQNSTGGMDKLINDYGFPGNDIYSFFK
jgi:ABC-type polysaccharide/polyol phosphate export permease